MIGDDESLLYMMLIMVMLMIARVRKALAVGIVSRRVCLASLYVWWTSMVGLSFVYVIALCSVYSPSWVCTVCSGSKRPQGVHVDANSGTLLDDLFSGCASQDGLGQSDITTASRKPMVRESGTLRFALDKDKQQIVIKVESKRREHLRRQRQCSCAEAVRAESGYRK